jgi:hypothetical protein
MIEPIPIEPAQARVLEIEGTKDLRDVDPDLPAPAGHPVAEGRSKRC